MKSPTRLDLKKLPHHSQIYFACFCAEQVFHLIELKHQPICRHAIDIAKLFIEGKATKEECGAATVDVYATYAAYDTADAYAAYAAAANANAAHAADAAHAATDAAYAAAYAAYAAGAYDAAAADDAKNKQAVIEAQWEYYKELLTFETIIEDVLLA